MTVQGWGPQGELAHEEAPQLIGFFLKGMVLFYLSAVFAQHMLR